MEKKQKKEYIKIIIFSILIVLIGISFIFTTKISFGIRTFLYKLDIRSCKNDMVVHYINVGQGDAIALNLPNDKVVLIDAGPKDSQNIVIQYLKNQVLSGSNNLIIDYVILTHSDLDHSGGISGVFNEFDVKKFFRPNIASDSEMLGEFPIKSTTTEYDEAIKRANEEDGLEIEIMNKEYDFYIDKVHIQIFPPVKAYTSTNEMSSVIKVTYLGKSFLFTADIQEESERDMLNKYGAKLDADILKVAHHGSKTSTSSDFVNIVSPRYAIISVGSNSYGHPHFDTITTLQSFGAEILSTTNGDIRFVCGDEMFGVLDGNAIHSFEFVDYWVFALLLEMIFISLVIMSTIKSIKLKKDIYIS